MQLSDQEQIRTTVQQFYDSLKPGSHVGTEEILAENWVDHTLPPGRNPGVPGFHEALLLLQAALPDLQVTVEQMIVEGDMVAVRLYFEGTHLGTFGQTGPTARPIRFLAFDMHRVEDNRIVESWHLEDNLGFLSAIGALGS